MPAEWTLSVVVPIINGKVDIRICSCYRFVKFDHGISAELE